jgi:hypothetical protein
MIEHKFKTWFPDKKIMTEPWTIEDVALTYDMGCKVGHGNGIIGDGISVDAGETYTFENHIKRQYTGRKDKNGKEIYDGDIVILGGEDIFYVDFMCGVYLLCWNDEFFIHREKMLADFAGRELEIIGDIYQNPELMDY